MIDILPLVFLFVIVCGGLFLLVFMTKKMTQEAEGDYSNMRKTLGADGWKITTSGGETRSLYFTGTFMGRNVRCDYRKTIAGSFLDISSKPHNVPKKTPWYKFIANHPIIYKNYTLIYSTVTARMSGMMDLSTERCNEILTDLNHTCEMVERGEYELN